MMRGEIIWNKGAGAGISMAWGSWQSASNPVLRDVHEYILVFSKGAFRRVKPNDKENTITKEQFMEWTKSVWTITPESAHKVGHPAPFPVELPFRLVQLYTFPGDVVLDPFMGSGATALAASKSGRKFIGYETEPGYVTLAEKRIRNFEPESGLLAGEGTRPRHKKRYHTLYLGGKQPPSWMKRNSEGHLRRRNTRYSS